MPVFFLKPENALKRAREFLEVGKKEPALDSLADVIKSKKHRTWQKVHEEIMEQYLQLCVELRRGHLAKEGLYQYKLICQQVSIASLEDSIRFFLRLANEKAEEARKNSQQTVEDGKVILDVDDLDNIQTPESLLLSTVSAEDTQARTDRVLLTPWVKFLWEAYRSVLDLLRNNAKVEKIYHEVAKEAFTFCVDYARRTEFRKLCDNLRQHLVHIQTYQNQANSVNLNSPESMQMHVETRIQQLETAIALDLWQEAFKAINDVHGLLNLSKKQPRPAMVANYLMKQATVYWMANNPLFHAAACHRLLVLSREQKKNLSDIELGKLSSRVVAATLAVPLHSSISESNFTAELNEIGREKHRKLAGLLQLSQPPSRASLIRDVLRLDILNYIPAPLKQLFAWLEEEFHPLQMCERVVECIAYLDGDEELKQYSNNIKIVATSRLLQQVAQVYSTIEIKRLLKLAPFVTNFGLENSIVRAAKLVDLQVRIDHRSQTVTFGADVSLVEQSIEGPMLQAMPAEDLRKQLSCMARSLEKAVGMVASEEVEDRVKVLRRTFANVHRERREKEHRSMLKRKTIIEKKKEEIESLAQAKERQERALEQEKIRKTKVAEQARLKKEAEEREVKRKKEELAEIGRRQVLEKIEQIKKTAIGGKALANLKPEDIENLDADSLVRKQMAELDKEKRELAMRLRTVEKKVDHFERAKRLVELPLLQEQYEKQKLEDEVFFNQMEKEKIEKATSKRKDDEENKVRLQRMDVDAQCYIERLSGHRNLRYQDDMKEFSKNLERERKLWQEDKIRQAEEQREIEEERIREVERQREEERRIVEEERRVEEEYLRQEEERRVAAEERRVAEEERLKQIKLDGEEERRRAEAPDNRKESREWRTDGARAAGLGRDGDRREGGEGSRDADRRGDRGDFSRDGDRRDVGRDERRGDFGRGDFSRDGDRRDVGRDERRGDFGRGFGRDERQGGGYGRDDRRGDGRDDRYSGGFRRDDRRDQPRDYGRSDQPRDYGRSDQPRDLGRSDQPRDLGRSDQPRDFGKGDQRDFGRDDQRDVGRGDQRDDRDRQGERGWRSGGGSKDSREQRDGGRGGDHANGNGSSRPAGNSWR